MKKLILASASPRRQKLVKKLGIPFIVDPSNFEEYVDMTQKPEDLAIALSVGKAKTVVARHSDSIILAADTFVVLEGKYINKPNDRQEAKEMLEFQSGKKATIVTGFTLLDTSSGKVLSQAVVSYITLKPLTQNDIATYLNKNTYMDKAGAYAVQEIGEDLIEKIEGDYDNIVGLPVEEIRKSLITLGI